jgi:16S rRNA (adenine1518-N6/adenine1519-N6)-dimethyltransferase
MTDTFPRTTRALRSALEERGLGPRKRHGQHFLTDAQAVDAVVRDAGVGPGDAVVEIGTGTGLLTHALCEAGVEVDSFDIDAQMIDLAKSLRRWPASVRFHRADALEGKHELSREVRDVLSAARARAGASRHHVVSNLPYNAATPILLALLSLPEPPATVTAMVQEEVAEKLLAQEGARAYGPPSILVALRGRGSILRRFPPQVFWPAPAVRSALLRLVPRADPAIPAEEIRPFSRFLLDLFSRRRKVLPSALRAAKPSLSGEDARRLLEDEGLLPTTRPEAVAPETLLSLFRKTRER